MPKYILKRIVGTIPTLIIVVTFVFFFVRLIPGDPARLVAGEQATQDDVEEKSLASINPFRHSMLPM